MRSILALALLCCLCGVAQARPGYICDQNGCRPAPKAAAAPSVQRPLAAKRGEFRPFQRLRARFQAMRARRGG